MLHYFMIIINVQLKCFAFASFNNSESDFVKGIVHPKMKMWCLSAYPKGIQDVGDFVSSVETQTKIFNSNRCSLSVI